MDEPDTDKQLFELKKPKQQLTYSPQSQASNRINEIDNQLLNENTNKRQTKKISNKSSHLALTETIFSSLTQATQNISNRNTQQTCRRKSIKLLDPNTEACYIDESSPTTSPLVKRIKKRQTPVSILRASKYNVDEILVNEYENEPALSTEYLVDSSNRRKSFSKLPEMIEYEDSLQVVEKIDRFDDLIEANSGLEFNAKQKNKRYFTI